MIKCTAAKCRCGQCGTSGRGDIQAALARVKEKVQAELRRLALHEANKPTRTREVA